MRSPATTSSRSAVATSSRTGRRAASGEPAAAPRAPGGRRSRASSTPRRPIRDRVPWRAEPPHAILRGEMSQENVEIVLAVLRDFNQRRRANPAMWHDDCRLTGPEGWPERGPWEGKADVLRQFDRLIEDFSRFDVEDVQV